ncbi:ABC transporter permease subunit [Streptococcus tangpeifui]|uniref:ABC transporter permease subunit n=1 Tax=Streptococcus tangpeifui TaxID=2709400 RepID=UPI0013EAE167|nr:ABC transporter permease subunit [Streptococcus sp. ZJ373]
MNKKQIAVIIRKDLQDFFSDKSILGLFIFIPLLFSLILPVLLIKLGNNELLFDSINGMDSFVDNLPATILPKGIDNDLAPLYALLIFFMLPLFMMLPIIFSNLIASFSFIGEKEHKTLEGLLSTPISPQSLLVGKMLASMIPAVLVTWLAMVVYGVIVDVMGYSLFHHLLFPNITWLISGLLVSPLLVMLSSFLVLGASQYLKTSKSAQSVSMLLILPLVTLMISQSTGVMLIGLELMLIIVGILALFNGLAFYILTKIFNMEAYITQ